MSRIDAGAIFDSEQLLDRNVAFALIKAEDLDAEGRQRIPSPRAQFHVPARGLGFIEQLVSLTLYALARQDGAIMSRAKDAVNRASRPETPSEACTHLIKKLARSEYS